MPPLSPFQKSCIALAVGQALLPTNLRAGTIDVDIPGTADACTIQDAIAAANSDLVVGNCNAGSGPDTINLPEDGARFDLADTPGNQGLLVTSEITIQGNNSIISLPYDSNFNERLITAEYADLTLNDLALDGGELSQNGGEEGAAIHARYSSIQINRSSISDSSVSGSGGAIWAYSSSLTLSQVNMRCNSASQYGGGIYARESSLIIDASSLRINAAGAEGGAIFGGEAPAVPPSTISNSYISSNSADTYGGAIRWDAGALTVTDSNLRRNTVGGEGRGYQCGQQRPILVNGSHSNGYGGAISIRGDLTLTGSTLSNNTASVRGGGVHIADGDLSVNQSTFHRNRIRYDNNGSIVQQVVPGEYTGGGAIFIDPDAGGEESHTIANSTLAANYANGGEGTLLVGAGALTITNSTIVAGGEGGEGDAITAYGGSTTVNMQNSVVSIGGEGGRRLRANGRGELCHFSDGAQLGQNTNNFFEDSSCDGYNDGDARLGRINRYTPAGLNGGEAGGDVNTCGSRYNNNCYGDYGVGNGNGLAYVRPPVQTIYIPLFDSPLQDAGNTTICADAPVGGVDQRRIAHAGSNCDIGAIDSRNTVITVNNPGDNLADGVVACTLRDALLSAAQGGEGLGGESGGPMMVEKTSQASSKLIRSNKASGNPVASKVIVRPGSSCAVSYDQTTINFDPFVFPVDGQTTITKSSSYSYSSIGRVSTPVTINGPGVDALTVSGGGYSGRLLELSDANLYINNMTLSDVSSSNQWGGAMRSYSSDATLENMALSNNYAYRGGAVRASNSVLTLENTTVSGNTARSSGGAINVSSNTEMTITQSTISGNFAGANSSYSRGGGITAYGRGNFITLDSSTISGNSALVPGSGYSRGGGLYLNSYAYARIVNSTLSGNAAEWGGGLSIGGRGANAYTFNATISDNEALNYGRGGGISLGNQYGWSWSGGNFNGVNTLISGNTANSLTGVDIYVGNYSNAGMQAGLVGSAELEYDQSVYTHPFANLSLNDSIIATSTVYGGGPNLDSTPLAAILGPLANNGGPTLTHNLVNNSPAIDGGEQDGCGGMFGGSPILDQRGRFRNDGSCDIGAVEFDNSSFFIIRAVNGNIIVINL